MVITRFLAALSPQYEYTETDYVFEVSGERFKCRTKAPRVLGWKRFYTDNDEENAAPLNFSEGFSFEAKNLTISECETQPPKRFTESTLLKSMENIDRRIEDKELSEYVSERGLGTPATRAAIIERIIKVGYIERKGKQLVTTDKGKKVISLLPDEVKSVEMTAAMELQLSAIENGTIAADEVITGIVGKIKSIITAENSKEHISLAPPREPVGKCPRCGGNIYKFVKDSKAVFYCENSPKSCFFRIYEDDFFFTSKGKTFTEDILKKLLLCGKAKVSGFKSERTGKKYDAIVSLTDRTDKNGNKKVGFAMEFENKKK